MYGLREGSTCGDVPATLCCGPCALCQEAREMKSRSHYAGKSRDADHQTTSFSVLYQPAHIKQPPQEVLESRTF
ncbi:unnamed protein product [Rotaria sordida]|uniref:Uncharacterized protein n=1 Tax=Rotaria sordida TaxID=392033 RepID=A0A814QWD8_9BILA|nr:unnamed protein product [Rotaria sordida]